MVRIRVLCLPFRTTYRNYVVQSFSSLITPPIFRKGGRYYIVFSYI